MSFLTIVRSCSLRRIQQCRPSYGSLITSIRCMSLFPQTKKDDEISVGVKTKEVVKIKQYLDDEGANNNYDSKKFIETIENFNQLKRLKRFGYAEFINAALPAMVEYGVHKDLEAYKSLMRVFPKGAFIPTSKIASGLFPHVVQQRSALNIIDQMEENNIMPDKEFETLVIDVFSTFSEVWKKTARMTYWGTKFKNANVFPFPEVMPTDPLELAIIALKRMSIDPQTDVTVYRTTQLEELGDVRETVEDTWLCFVQSDSQQELINELDFSHYRVSLEGPFNVWVTEHLIKYFVLIARDTRPKKKINAIDEQLKLEHNNHDVSDIPLSNFGSYDIKNAINPLKELHIQDDGTILGIVSTGTSSHQSLIAWLKIFEKENPRLKSVSVLVTNSDTNGDDLKDKRNV